MLEKFNEETKSYILKYINDLDNTFPNLFSKEELINIIENNLDSNIDFNASFKNDRTTGVYDIISKEISISKDLIEPQLEWTLFHEFTHCITNKYISNKDYFPLECTYIVEILVTEIEKKFIKQKTSKDINRVNGYISDFGEQLRIIYDDDILKKFLKEPDKIHEIIYAFGSNFLPKAKWSTYRNFVRRMQYLNNCINTSESDSVVISYNEDLEKDILMQLRIKIDQEELSLDNLDRLNRLYQSQHYPDNSKYYNILENRGFKELKEIETYKNFTTLIKMFETSDKIKLLDIFEEYENDYDYLNNVRSNSLNNLETLLIYKIFDFPFDYNNIECSLDEFYMDQSILFDNKKYYNCIIHLIIANELNLDELKNMTINTQNDNKKDFTNLLLKGKENIIKENFFSLFKNNDYKIAGLYNNNELQYIITDKTKIFRKYNINDLYNECLSYDDIVQEDTINVINRLKNEGINQLYCDVLELTCADTIYLNNNTMNIYIEDENNNIIEVNINKKEKDYLLDKTKVDMSDKNNIYSSFSTKAYTKTL